MNNIIINSRFRWLGLRRAKKHVRVAVSLPDPERVVHAIVVAEGKPGFPSEGENLIVACTCCAVFWFNKKYVPESELSGDWARPIRDSLQVPARVVNPKSVLAKIEKRSRGGR